MKKVKNALPDKKRVSHTNVPMTPTGYMYLDYNIGKMHRCFNDAEEVTHRYRQLGFPPGILSIAGKSAGGKTTAMLNIGQAVILQTMSEVVSQFIYSQKLKCFPMFTFIDAENKFDISFAKRTMQLKNSVMKETFDVQKANSAGDICKIIDDHCAMKETTMEMIYHEFRDIYGDQYYNYPLTIIGIDSVNQIISDKIEGFDDRVQNTAGLMNAKAIQNVFSHMSSKCIKYNILFVVIQHVLLDANLDFLPKPKQYRGLKKDEKFVAGEKGILLSSYIVKVEHVADIGTSATTKNPEDFGDGVEGFLSRFNIIKSSSNVLGRSCHMVSLGATGYSRLLSTFYEATIRGDLPKEGNFYTIPGVKGKFTKKNFLQKCEEDFDIAKGFYEYMSNKLTPLLSSTEVENEELEVIEENVESVNSKKSDLISRFKAA